MSDQLKKGWRVWRFDQMASMVNDRIDDPAEANVEYYVGLEHLDPESLTIRRWGSPSDVNATKLLFRKGDIIFGRRRVYQRKLAVAHFDGICSAHALVLRAKPEVVVPEFLPFFMQSDLFMDRSKQISVGSLSPTINWKTLAKEEFALPPMEEQKMLIALLSAINHSIEKFYKVKSQATSIKQSYLGQVINETWELVKISDVAQVVTGKTPPTSKLDYWKDEVDFATPADFKYDSGELYTTERKISEKGISKSKVVQAKATLVVCIGSTIGKVAQTIKRTAFNQQINAVLCHSADPDYFYAISTKLGQELKKLSGNTAVPIINKSEFENIKIPLPPLEKQIEVGKFYKILALAEKYIDSRLIDLLAYRNNIINRVLLRG